MMAIGDYQAVLSHLETQQKQWAGFQFSWLQSYQFAKYIFWSKQVENLEQVLTAVGKNFPESLTLVSTQLATGFNKKQQPEQALKLLNRVKEEGTSLPTWHKQMSVYYASVNKPKLAEQHQQMALKLAKQYQFESWEVWELM